MHRILVRQNLACPQDRAAKCAAEQGQPLGDRRFGAVALSECLSDTRSSRCPCRGGGRALHVVDANDFLYQVDASRNYDPSGRLRRIIAPVTWVNSADDFINPPELGIAERAATKLKRGRFVLIPASAETHGHGTHIWAALWKDKLAELLRESE